MLCCVAIEVTRRLPSGFTFGVFADRLKDLPVDVWHWMGDTRRPPTQDAFRKLLMKLDPDSSDDLKCIQLSERVDLSGVDQRGGGVESTDRHATDWRSSPNDCTWTSFSSRRTATNVSHCFPSQSGIHKLHMSVRISSAARYPERMAPST